MTHIREEHFGPGLRNSYFLHLEGEYSPSICPLHVFSAPFEYRNTLHLMTLSSRPSRWHTT